GTDANALPERPGNGRDGRRTLHECRLFAIMHTSTDPDGPGTLHCRHCVGRQHAPARHDMTDSSNPLILIDGSSWLFRAYHVLPPLTTQDGRPTGAIHGMSNMLRRCLRDYDAERIVVVCDAPGKTFRSELFPDYKAHRPPVPEELSDQFDGITAIVCALGLPLIQEAGVEADDVIGTLAARDDGEVLIVTSDKDMAQLVNERVHLLDTMKDKRTDIDGVRDKFGVGPECIIDYLALVGDTSDNIPGVPKVGPKTAAKWLHK